MHQELYVVGSVLRDQERVLLSFQDSLDPQSHPNPAVSCAMNFALHKDSISRVLIMVNDLHFDCTELTQKAERLAAWTAQLVQTRQAESARIRWGRRLSEAFHSLKGNATKTLILERRERRPPSRLNNAELMMKREEDDIMGTARDDAFPSILPYSKKGRQPGGVDAPSASEPPGAFTAFFEVPHPEDAHDFRIAAFKLLWDNFPQKKELQNRVANPGDPGDGLVYSIADIGQAIHVLNKFYQAWHQNQAQLPCPPPEKLQQTTKVCLVLNGMRQKGMFEDFHNIEFTDSDLPLVLSQCRQLFEPDHPNCAEIFVSEQYRVISRPWNDGDHIDIRANEPLPLKYRGKYRAGTFGMVNRVCDAFSGEVFALKQQTVLDTDSSASENLEHFQREAGLLKGLRHRHIIQLAKTYRRNNTFGLLLRPPASTNLEILLEKFRNDEHSPMHGRRDSERLRPILLQSFGCLSCGLAYIHGHQVRHRDINPANILFEDEGRNDPRVCRGRFIWADFGLVYKFDDLGKSITQDRNVNLGKYAPPESSRLSTRAKSADIFSLGCIFLEILAALFKEIMPLAEEPFSEALPRLSYWATKTREQNKSDISAQLFPLAIHMIHGDPSQRPSLNDIQLYLSNTSERFFCDPCWNEQRPPGHVVSAKNIKSQALKGLVRSLGLARIEAVTFLVYWDLKQYVQKELELDFNSKGFASVLENVLTISGTIEKAYASSLRDYMRWKWPDSKLDILEHLKEVLQPAGKGKSTSLEFISSRSAIVLLSSAAVWNTLSDEIWRAKYLYEHRRLI